jgi:RNA 3'-terminal phosphate cyclase (ATP)
LRRRRRRRRRHARGGDGGDGGDDDGCPSSSTSSGDDDDDEGGGGEGKPPVLDVRIVRRGYYPKGGGVVRVDIRSIPPPAATVPRGVKLFPPLRLAECRPMASISIRAFHAGRCPSRVAREMASGAAKELERAWYGESPRFRDRFSSRTSAVGTTDGGGGGGPASSVPPPPIAVRIVRDADCAGSGSGILLVAHPEGATSSPSSSSSPCPALASSGIGDARSSPSETGRDASRELVRCVEDGGCVDRWMQDQLIPFMALADDSEMSEMLTGELTLHTRTAMWVAERMTGCAFEVERVDVDVDGGEDDAAGGGVVDGNERAGYGEKGRVPGRHVIRCRGIGFAHPGRG